jgi:AcrR family transcriptional regulator
MPRTEEENLRIREEQKRHIIQSAVKVLARKGVGATKMADIAAEAEVSYGLVYHYFSNKEQIFSELLEEALERGSGNLQRALETSGTSWDRLQMFVTDALQSFREHPEFLVILYQALQDEEIHSKLWERVQSKRRLMMGAARCLITEGQAAGQVVQDDPDLLVGVLLSIFHGMACAAVIRGGEIPVIDARVVMRLFKP